MLFHGVSYISPFDCNTFSPIGIIIQGWKSSLASDPQGRWTHKLSSQTGKLLSISRLGTEPYNYWLSPPRPTGEAFKSLNLPFLFLCRLTLRALCLFFSSIRSRRFYSPSFFDCDFPGFEDLSVEIKSSELLTGPPPEKKKDLADWIKF